MDFPSSFGIALDLADVGELRGHPIEHVLAQLRVRDLTAAEHHRHLHLVAFFQESPRVPGLRVEVVIVDARTVLHFLEVNDVLLLLRRLAPSSPCSNLNLP